MAEAVKPPQRLLGLIGGVSPESTAIYYRLLNAAARRRFGGEHSARVSIFALDYGVMISHYHRGDWPSFIAEVVDGGKRLAAGGAEALVITSNTTHVAADALGEATGLPVIHMLDALSASMVERGARRPLLLGTPAVMAGDFYRTALGARFAGEILTPTGDDQVEIGRIILEELVEGVVRGASRDALLSIIARHTKDGADAVILGCTELCMILCEEHLSVPVFDTTAIHAAAAAKYAHGDD